MSTGDKCPIPHHKDKGDDALNDLAEYAQVLLQDSLNIDTELAAKIALELAEKIRLDWGGQYIYFKKHTSNETRDGEIFSKFNEPGTDSFELAKEHNITIQRLYQIIKKYKSDN
ncbi:MAG: hypothetical protein FVQ79_00495 [Planctomycetes bacterium]|nr:hypothetical protein [Planctomycetota bacterium]